MNQMLTPRRRRRWPWVAGGLAGAGGLLVVFVAANSGRPIPVHTVRPTRGVVEDLVIGSSVGTVEPEQTATLSAEVAGRVVEVRVRQGRAARGTIVIRLDPADLEAELKQTKRDLDTTRLRVDQAQLRAAKIDAELTRLRGTDEPLQRIEALEKDLAIARKEVEIATATVHSMEISVERIELRLAKTSIAAPFDGIVTKLRTEVGETVVPGTPLFEFQSAPPYLVRVPIDETDVGRLRLDLEARATFDALRDRSFAGTVAEIMPAASTDNRNNRTVDVKVRLAEFPEEIAAGMSAHVEIVVSRTGPDALRVPTAHIREDAAAKSRYVFVLDGVAARKRTIKTGVWNWEWTEVVDGLSPADTIITDAADPDLEVRLRDGLPVREADGR